MNSGSSIFQLLTRLPTFLLVNIHRLFKGHTQIVLVLCCHFASVRDFLPYLGVADKDVLAPRVVAGDDLRFGGVVGAVVDTPVAVAALPAASAVADGHYAVGRMNELVT